MRDTFVRKMVPMNAARIYMTQPVWGVSKSINPIAITQMTVPVLRAAFLPNMM